MLVAFGWSMNAQNAIGLRGGWGGTELSYQKGLGSNRLELDLGWWGNNHDHWNYIYLCGVYQWTGTITGPLGWYAGVGANLGLFTGDAIHNDNLGLALGVQGGLELGLDDLIGIPFQLTLDVRPMWNFIGHNSGFGWGAALGLRYKF